MSRDMIHAWTASLAPPAYNGSPVARPCLMCSWQSLDKMHVSTQDTSWGNVIG